MTANRNQLLAGMTTRQKVTAGIFVVVLLFLIYQIWVLFRGGSAPAQRPAAKRTTTRTTTTATKSVGVIPASGQSIPQSTVLPRQQIPMSQREAELLRLQQETEAKYIAALNELQMLRLARDIAETNKAIATARLDTVTAEKGIVDLLKPPPPVTPTAYAQGLLAPTRSGAEVTPAQQMPAVTVTTTTTTTQPETPYSVISVSQLQNRWSAVLGFQGRLYNVFTGDILPPDQSKVMTIDRSGVILEKNGVRRKISLVPII